MLPGVVASVVDRPETPGAFASDEQFADATDATHGAFQNRRDFHGAQAFNMTTFRADEVRVSVLIRVFRIAHFEAPDMVTQLGAIHQADFRQI